MKGKGKKLHRNNNLKASISPEGNSINNSDITVNTGESNFEIILNDMLVKLTSVIIKSKAVSTQHDTANIADHILKCAEDTIEEKMRKVIADLINFNGPSLNHKFVVII